MIEILKYKTFTITKVQDSLLDKFLECQRLPLQHIESHPQDSRGWRLLILIPAMILWNPGRGGESSVAQVKRRFRLFGELRFAELLSTSLEHTIASRSRKIAARKEEDLDSSAEMESQSHDAVIQLEELWS